MVALVLFVVHDGMGDAGFSRRRARRPRTESFLHDAKFISRITFCKNFETGFGRWKKLFFDLRESGGYHDAMNLFGRRAISLIAFFLPFILHAQTFRVATYNLENYLDQPTETRHYAKSAEAKQKSAKAFSP
jgi:hypothetical protein